MILKKFLSGFLIFILIGNLSIPAQANWHNRTAVDSYRHQIGRHTCVLHSPKHYQRHTKSSQRRNRPPLSSKQFFDMTQEKRAKKKDRASKVIRIPPLSDQRQPERLLSKQLAKRKVSPPHPGISPWTLVKYGLIFIPLLFYIANGQTGENPERALAQSTTTPASSPADLTLVDLLTTATQPTFEVAEEESPAPEGVSVHVMDRAERVALYGKLDKTYRASEVMGMFWDTLESQFKDHLGNRLPQQQAEDQFLLPISLTYGDLFRAYQEIHTWKQSITPPSKMIPLDRSSSTVVVKQFHYAIGERGDILTTVDLTKCVGLALYNTQTHRGGLGHLAGENIKDLDQYLEGSFPSPHSIQQFVSEVAQDTPFHILKATLVCGYPPHISYFKSFLEHLGVTDFRIIYDKAWGSGKNNQFDQPTGNLALDCATGTIYGVKNVRDVYNKQGPSTFHSGGAPLSFKRQDTSKDKIKAVSKSSSETSSKLPLNKKKERNRQRRGTQRHAHHDEL